jgi:hypothetical protein
MLSPVSASYEQAVVALAGGGRSLASATRWLKKNKASELAALKREWAPHFHGVCRTEMYASAHRLDGKGYGHH